MPLSCLVRVTCLQIPWDQNPEALAKWAEGRTGFPWIDAIMTQLRQEGWIHHLARHAVACFLTRGDLWVSWESGMRVGPNSFSFRSLNLMYHRWRTFKASLFVHCLVAASMTSCAKFDVGPMDSIHHVAFCVCCSRRCLRSCCWMQIGV